MKNENVILSTALLLGEGTFTMEEISLEDAKVFAKMAKNYIGHSTVRILDIEPAMTREECKGYKNALVIKVNGRLDFGVEYTREKIEEIGVKFFLIQDKSDEISSLRNVLNDALDISYGLTGVKKESKE